LCEKTLQSSAEGKESFEDSKRTNIRRESAFMHRTLQVIAEAKRVPFGGFKFREAQEGQRFQERRQK
jgi:hypothetical protein